MRIFCLVFLLAFSPFLGAHSEENHPCEALVARLSEQINELALIPSNTAIVPPDVQPYIAVTFEVMIEALKATLKLLETTKIPSPFTCTALKNLITENDQTLADYTIPISTPPIPDVVIAQNITVHHVGHTYEDIFALYSLLLATNEQACNRFHGKRCPNSTAKSLKKYIAPLRELGLTTPPFLPILIPPTEATNTTIRNIRTISERIRGRDLTRIVCNTLKQLNIQLAEEIKAAHFNLPNLGFPAALVLTHTQQHLAQIFDSLYILVEQQRECREK